MGALMVWDYAGGGPYLPITMTPSEGAEIDALVLSPHKFIGGPGASGVVIVRRDVVVTDRPTWAGGGTVRFVTSQDHDYAGDIEHREEGGTPNVIGDIRAALAARALAAWQDAPEIEVLGHPEAQRLPIISFRIRDPQGGFIHQQLVTKMLSD